MKKFTSVIDVNDPAQLVYDALSLKLNPLKNNELGKNKTLGLIFFNASLRTRLSTQKAAFNLGMNVIVLNVEKEAWALEFKDGAIMNGSTVEHIQDAAMAISTYCEILGIRCFPGLKNKDEDYEEIILNQFIKYCTVPVISLESATLHPLQSLADMMTIREVTKRSKPKVVLTWAPHVKPCPQAVANSFMQWNLALGHDFTIVQPPGYELSEEFSQGCHVMYDQDKALQGADFVYVKNWSSFQQYGLMPDVKDNWLLDKSKIKVTNDAKIMHCLPVRRNVELPDFILNSENSLISLQAENRVYAAQIVLKNLLSNNF